MLSASKLYQSSSISGPLATVKPSRAKVATMSSSVCETGWRWPGPPAPGSVTSSSRPLELGVEGRSCALRGVGELASISALAVDLLADGAPLFGGELAHAPRWRRARLLAEVLHAHASALRHFRAASAALSSSSSFCSIARMPYLKNSRCRSRTRRAWFWRPRCAQHPGSIAAPRRGPVRWMRVESNHRARSRRRFTGELSSMPSHPRGRHADRRQEGHVGRREGSRDLT